MGKFIDETGNVHGRLTVIKRVENKNHQACWLCQCECGNQIIAFSYKLRNGHTKSCGCLQKEHAAKLGHSKAKDLTGQRFGKLAALEPTDKRDSSNHYVMWKCQCDCGNIHYASSNLLLMGHINSCGCLKSKGELKIEQILKENNINYEKQKTFKTCYLKIEGNLAKFDFYLPELNCIIEYDGEQHFRYNNYGWDTEDYFNKIHEYDLIKNQWCKDNNIILIRIPYLYYNDIKLEDLLPNSSKFILSED